MSPNLFLNLNFSFNLIISVFIILNYPFSNPNLNYTLIGIFMFYISIMNAVISAQKSQPKLKKTTLLSNALLFYLISILLLKNAYTNFNKYNILILSISLFIMIINIIGYKITRV